jgi:hypothetical protein
MRFPGALEHSAIHVIAYNGDRIVPGLTSAFTQEDTHQTLIIGGHSPIRLKNLQRLGVPTIEYDDATAYEIGKKYTIDNSSHHDPAQPRDKVTLLPHKKIIRLALKSNRIQGIEETVTELRFMFTRSWLW